MKIGTHKAEVRAGSGAETYLQPEPAPEQKLFERRSGSRYRYLRLNNTASVIRNNVVKL
jgi:hypothetical protein